MVQYLCNPSQCKEKNLDNNPNKVHMHKRKNAFAHIWFSTCFKYLSSRPSFNKTIKFSSFSGMISFSIIFFIPFLSFTVTTFLFKNLYRKINVKHAVRFCGSKTILIITLTLQHNFCCLLATLYPYKFETDFRGSAVLGGKNPP